MFLEVHSVVCCKGPTGGDRRGQRRRQLGAGVGVDRPLVAELFGPGERRRLTARCPNYNPSIETGDGRKDLGTRIDSVAAAADIPKAETRARFEIEENGLSGGAAVIKTT